MSDYIIDILMDGNEECLADWEILGEWGEFYIDSINFSGPPDVVNIRAISYDLNSDIVDKKENHVWENVDFKTIITEIAKNRKIEKCNIKEA